MIKVYDLYRCIYFFLLYFLITYTFFVRGEFFPNIGILNNSAIGIIFSSVLLTAYYFLTKIGFFQKSDKYKIKKMSLVVPNKIYFVFGISILISFFINFFFIANHFQVTIIRFLFEIGLNGLVFYVAYFSVRKLSSVVKILSIIQLSSLVAIWTIFSVASQLESIRRIGANQEGEGGLSIAASQIGHALAIAAIISAFQIFSYFLGFSKKNLLLCLVNILLFLLSVVALFLTGSRGSMLGLLVYPILLILLRFNAKVLVQYLIFISVSIIFLLISLILISTLDLGSHIELERISSLLSRFNFESITWAIQNRIEVFKDAYSSIGNKDYLIFGKMWAYQPINQDSFDNILYPHNFMLSILLHLGILPLLSFISIILRLFYLFFINQYKLKKENTYQWLVYVTVFAIFLVTLIHVSKGGRLTRVITIFFTLGLFEGYTDQLKHRELRPDLIRYGKIMYINL